MAASYQTGTATSPTNLLQTLVTWLVAQGWTQHASAADGAGHRAHLSKGGLYVNLRSAVSESVWAYQNGTSGWGIGLYLGDGYSAGADWKSQSGGPLASGTSNTVGAAMNLPSGAISAYHFFDDGGDHVTVVVERSPGVFVFLGWGPSLAKIGYTTDCPYFFASSPSYYTAAIPTGLAGGTVTAHPPTSPVWNPNTLYATTFFRVDASWIAVTKAAGGNNAGYTGREGRAAVDLTGQFATTEHPNWARVAARGWQSAYAGALLLPAHLFVNTQPANRWAPAGYPPAIFRCEAVGHGWGANEVYAVGGLNYMVFPGFAVRKAA